MTRLLSPVVTQLSGGRANSAFGLQCQFLVTTAQADDAFSTLEEDVLSGTPARISAIRPPRSS